MEERFAISEEELHVAHLRRVNRRIVDLRNDAVPDGKPDAARGGV